VFVEASGKAFNTIPPTDIGFYELLNELVQEQPVGQHGIELMGELAAIGIVKGKPFAPDERMRRILEDAAAVGTATSRALVFDPRASEGFAYYDGSAWENKMWVGGYNFETPPPLVTEDGIKPFPPTGFRALHSRSRGSTRIPGSRLRCACGSPESGRSTSSPSRTPTEPPRRGKTYRVTLPPTSRQLGSGRSPPTTPRPARCCRRRSASRGPEASPTRHPAATADDDGSTTVVFAPERPADTPEGNWIQTTEGKGWFPILRLYSPLQSFFDKSWRPSEIEAVKTNP
jgi:hypothetical protein